MQKSKDEGTSASLCRLFDRTYKHVPQIHLKASLLWILTPVEVSRTHEAAQLTGVNAWVHSLIVPATNSVSDCDHIVSLDPRVFTTPIALLVVRNVAKTRLKPVGLWGLVVGRGQLLVVAELLSQEKQR